MIEKGLIVTCTLIICIIIRESISAVVLMKKNKELNKLAYIDLHTGLQNRSRVEELLIEYHQFEKPTAMIVFDLNDLLNAVSEDEVKSIIKKVQDEAIVIMNLVNKYILNLLMDMHFLSIIKKLI